MIFKRMGMRLLPALVLVGVVSGSTGVYAEGEGDGVWATAQKSGSIRCGTAEAPPYIMKDPATGEYSGFFVDACREFAEILKVKPVFVDTSWDNMIAGLQSRKWDLAPALTATPQRALSIVFSKISQLLNRPLSTTRKTQRRISQKALLILTSLA